jgi:hypothetical protein
VAETAVLQRIMQKHLRSLAHLTNAQLLEDVKTLAGREREATVQLIASLGELDARRLYLGEGFPSLFTYCTQLLHLSEHAAYRRIETARLARGIPEILEVLADGSLTLTTVGLLASHLTSENQKELLQAARHKSKREVEHIVAALRPQPAVPSSVRRLPAAKEVRSAPADVAVEPAQDRDGLGGDPTAATALVHMNPPALLPRPAVVAPLATNFGARRTCSGTSSPTAIPPLSSNGRSRCWWTISSGRSWRRRSILALPPRLRPGRGTSRRL